MKKEREIKTPIGIKISAIIIAIFGIILLFMFSVIITEFSSEITRNIIFLLSFIIPIILATGLWKLKNWARIIVNIILILVILFFIWLILGGILNIFIDNTLVDYVDVELFVISLIAKLFILIPAISIEYYLIFNKKVKEAFSNSKKL